MSRVLFLEKGRANGVSKIVFRTYRSFVNVRSITQEFDRY